MKVLNDEQIDKFLKDISSIKEVIDRNRPLLQKLLNPRRYRFFFLYIALAAIGISSWIYFLMQRYGDYASIPGDLRKIIHIVIITAVVLGQIVKILSISRSAKSIDKKLTFWSGLKGLCAYRIAHFWIPAAVVAIFFCIFFIMKGTPYFIIPTVAFFYGLVSNLMGPLVGMRNGLILGYWLLATGLVTVIFSSMPAPAAVILSYGCGMLIFAVLSFRSSGEGEEG